MRNLRFLDGGGAASQMIRDRDWSDHPLGSPAHWPEALRVSLGTILNSPESMILAWGPELFFFFNETYFPLLGPRLSWAMGARFDRVWADGWEQAKPIIDEAMAGRSKRYVDLPWRLDTDRGAADTWWTFSYSRVLDGDGQVAGLLIVTNETTNRILAERRASEEQERQRQLLAQMPGFVGVLSGPQHVYEYVNDAYREISGERDFIGRSIREVFPELAGQGFFELLDRVYETGERYTARGLPILLSDEPDHRFIDLLYEPIRDARGEVDGIFVGGYDATETYRKEAALRLLNTNLERQIVERSFARGRIWQLSPDVIGVMNAEGRFESSNPAWRTALGWSEEDVATTLFVDMIHPDDQHRTREAFERAITTGEPMVRFECRCHHRMGGWRWLSWDAVPDDGKLYCNARDVTAEREAEAELLRAQDALRQSQKMEAVGQLTGGIAHDFNNLLTGITGSLELLETRQRQGRLAETGKYIKAAQGASRRAAALTHRLLAFSRQQTLDPKPTDANRLVSGMEDLIRRSIGPSIALDVITSIGLWPVLIDPPQLENVLLNLCINARDAMPDGGRIRIETSNETLDEAQPRENDLAAGAYVTISVTDTGVGMTPEVKAKAFDPFFTTKPIGQGTGLGLSMTYGFIRQSGGQVHIRSEPGKGTTITLYLPRHHGAAAASATAAPVTLTRPGAGETVLIVDDEPTVRMLITDVLGSLGYRALEAHDGPSGLKLLQSDEAIDLLVTDVGLPGGMNGRQMTDAARLRRPNLKVLFITGYAEHAVLGSGQLSSDTKLMTKPFAVDELAARIQEMIKA